MLGVTGATGELGRLVLERLGNKVSSSGVVGLARNPAALAGKIAPEVSLRSFDYNQPAALAAQLEGIERLLIISSSELGMRVAQHRAIVDSAVAAGVKFVAYTSLLHADTSKIGIADEHRATERMLEESGLECAFLRNGWYAENFLGLVGPAIQFGMLPGCAGEASFSLAARLDFADAAIAVLTGNAPDQRIFELAGDTDVSMADLAAMISEMSGKNVVYQDMPQAQYQALLGQAGIPEPVAAMVADSMDAARSGALRGDGSAMRALIGRPTTPVKDVLVRAIS